MNGSVGIPLRALGKELLLILSVSHPIHDLNNLKPTNCTPSPKRIKEFAPIGDLEMPAIYVAL